MATGEEGGGMEDVDSSLEPEESSGGFMSSIASGLSSAKDKYVDFHTVDEDAERWGDQSAAGNLSRRGFLAGTAEVAAVGYGITEATDGDGSAIDLSRGEEPAIGGGPATGPAGENETANGAEDSTDTYGDNELGVQGDVSDELYLQEDGTVIAVDHGHKEWRRFDADNFSENQDYAELHSELSESRGSTDLNPPGLGSGVEVSQEELFDHDTTAYDDMADEAEWDLIFDSNPNYGGS